MSITKPIIILEGPDGGGKTTLGKRLAEQLGYRYVHSGPFKTVTHGLGRLSMEAMLPALLGYQGVVMDRAWLSELPYGIAFRGGLDRLGDVQRAMLDRVALRCGAIVVMCMPSWDNVEASYKARKAKEMLENVDQLRQVYDIYANHELNSTALPTHRYNYAITDDRTVGRIIAGIGSCHSLGIASAGNNTANILLVGERFTNHKDQDPFYQLPFVSFTGQGCSQWLTQGLIDHGISERNLMWVNADEVAGMNVATLSTKTVVALGDKASGVLDNVGVVGRQRRDFTHPQAWKRFKGTKPYPLYAAIQEILK